MISKDYLYTETWDDLESVILEENSVYLYAHDPEDRSGYCFDILSKKNENLFLELAISDEDNMIVTKDNIEVPLNSPNAIKDFLKSLNTNVLYFDVTGMNCRLVAPLIKSAIINNIQIYIVYLEPQDYTISEFKKFGINKDLSENYRGVLPLPGFTKIFTPDENPLFVILLGFEGGRFSYLVSNQQIPYSNIKPVIGVPGYKINYCFESFWGNHNPLHNTKAWEYVEYAEANSIVDIFLLLKSIYEKNHKPYMLIAPVGTKPHVIGAILYAIKNESNVELIYDNPKRISHRTNGVGKVIACNITKLYNEN